jgi:hypothetical protein
LKLANGSAVTVGILASPHIAVLRLRKPSAAALEKKKERGLCSAPLRSEI